MVADNHPFADFPGPGSGASMEHLAGDTPVATESDYPITTCVRMHADRKHERSGRRL